MSTPRRRLIRPAAELPPSRPLRPRQVQKLRERIDHERSALARWQTRLKRAFNSVEKLQRTIARLERKITLMENTG